MKFIFATSVNAPWPEFVKKEKLPILLSYAALLETDKDILNMIKDQSKDKK